MKWFGIAVAATLLMALAFGVGYRMGEARPVALLQGDSGSVESELRAILAVPTASERSARLGEFFERREPGDLPVIRDTFRTSWIDMDPVEFVLFAEWWASFDPAAAFQDAASWPLYDAHLGVASVVRAWARQDSAAALKAVKTIQMEDKRQRCIQALVAGWEESGQPGLLDYIKTLEDGIPQQKALDVFMARMTARQGIDSALAFAESQPDQEDLARFKLQVFRRTVTAVAAHDPQRAAKWAEQHAAGPYGDGLVRRVGVAWGNRDPNAAMGWLISLPPSRDRDDAVRETYRIWIQHHREDALAWIRGQGPVQALQPALGLVAVSLVRQQPEEALEWLARIDDVTLRQRASVALARAWLSSDREAALAWLADAPLPDEVKQEIENPRRPFQTPARRPVRATPTAPAPNAAVQNPG